MGLIISERKFTQEEIQKYLAKGYRLAESDGKNFPVVHRGEAVKFILNPKKMYSINIQNISTLLYTKKSKHHVTIEFEGKTYHLDNPEEWKKTYQDEHDQLRQVTEYHPVYERYREKCREYFEQEEVKTIAQQFDALDKYIDINMDEAELVPFVRAFAHLYDIEVDYNNKLSLLKAYSSIKYYMDNNLDYLNEVHSIAIEDEPMFSPEMFDLSKTSSEEQVEILPVGNETLFEDLMYKTTTTASIDDVLNTVNSTTDYQPCID